MTQKMTQEEKIQAAIAAWAARMTSPEVESYLDNDTWHGVAIGFLMGFGLTLEEAIETADRIDY